MEELQKKDPTPIKKYHLGKKIHTTKSGEFVLHQLYSQKKKTKLKKKFNSFCLYSKSITSSISKTYNKY